MIISGCRDSVIMVWRLGTDSMFTLFQKIEENSGWATSIKLNSESNIMAYLSSEGMMKIWKAQNEDSGLGNFKLEDCFADHKNPGFQLDMDLKGTFIITYGRKNRICVWVADSWSRKFQNHQILVSEHKASINQAILSGDSNSIFSCSDQSIKIWNKKPNLSSKIKISNQRLSGLKFSKFSSNESKSLFCAAMKNQIKYSKRMKNLSTKR